MKFTLNQKIAIGIRYSLEVYKEPKYVEWSNNWLEKKDRSKKAAYAAAVAAADDAAYAADDDVAYAAAVAVAAAYAYACAADDAAYAAAVAVAAAYAYACAVKRSIKIEFSIDLFAIIEKVLSTEVD